MITIAATQDSEKPLEQNGTKRRSAAQDMPSSLAMQEVFEISDAALMARKINEIRRLLWFREGTSKEKQHARIVRALQLYESLEPADGAEGMLAMQMVGTHDAALAWLRRAAIPSQTVRVRDTELKHTQN